MIEVDLIYLRNMNINNPAFCKVGFFFYICSDLRWMLEFVYSCFGIVANAVYTVTYL